MQYGSVEPPLPTVPRQVQSSRPGPMTPPSRGATVPPPVSPQALAGEDDGFDWSELFEGLATGGAVGLLSGMGGGGALGGLLPILIQALLNGKDANASDPEQQMMGPQQPKRRTPSIGPVPLGGP